MAPPGGAEELARRGLAVLGPLLVGPASKELPAGKATATLKARAEAQLGDDTEAALETTMLAMSEALHQVFAGDDDLKNHFGEALKVGKAAAALFKSSGKTSGEARALLVSGGAHLARKRPDLCTQVVQQALALQRSRGDALGEAAAFICLCEAHLASAEKTRLAISQLNEHVLKSRRETLNDQQNKSLDDARAAAEQAVEAARRSGDRKEEAHALLWLSQAHFAKQDGIEADNQARASAKIAREIGDQEQEAYAFTVIVQACLMNGDVAEALDVAEEMVDLQHNMKNQYLEAVAMMEVAKIYLKLQEEAGVLKWSKKAQAAFKGLGKLKEQVASKHTVLCYFASQKKYEDAETVARDCESLFRQSRDKAGEAMAMHWRSQVAILGFYNAWAPQMEEMYEWERTRGVKGKEHKEEEFNKQVKSYEEAIQTAETAFNIYKELGDEEGMAAVAATCKGAQDRSEEVCKKVCEPSTTFVMRAAQPIAANKSLIKEVKHWGPKDQDKDAEAGAGDQAASA